MRDQINWAIGTIVVSISFLLGLIVIAGLVDLVPEVQSGPFADSFRYLMDGYSLAIVAAGIAGLVRLAKIIFK